MVRDSCSWIVLAAAGWKRGVELAHRIAATPDYPGTSCIGSSVSFLRAYGTPAQCVRDIMDGTRVIHVVMGGAQCATSQRTSDP